MSDINRFLWYHQSIVIMSKCKPLLKAKNYAILAENMCCLQSERDLICRHHLTR